MMPLGVAVASALWPRLPGDFGDLVVGRFGQDLTYFQQSRMSAFENCLKALTGIQRAFAVVP
jgi:hypothetical protein